MSGTVNPLKIYCDANVLIEAVEGSGDTETNLNRIFKAAHEKEISLVTSSLSLAETLTKPIELRDDFLMRAYMALLLTHRRDLIEICDINRTILVNAAFVRARKKGIKLPDAIHIATAEHIGCQQILSRDKRLASATNIPIVDLGPDTLGRLMAANP